MKEDKKKKQPEEIIEECSEVQVEEAESEIIEQEQPLNILELQLLEKENLAKDYLDKFQRSMAEYDNFRKRTMKEKAQMYENGAKEVLEKILPITDNFQRALSTITDEEKGSSLAKGIELIYKQLVGVMKEIGVEEIEALGKTFDPNLHHAVAHEENEDFGANEVMDVLQNGYMFKERVLRYSMVKVAN